MIMDAPISMIPIAGVTIKQPIAPAKMEAPATRSAIPATAIANSTAIPAASIPKIAEQIPIPIGPKIGSAKIARIKIRIHPPFPQPFTLSANGFFPDFL